MEKNKCCETPALCSNPDNLGAPEWVVEQYAEERYDYDTDYIIFHYRGGWCSDPCEGKWAAAEGLMDQGHWDEHEALLWHKQDKEPMGECILFPCPRQKEEVDTSDLV